MKQPVIVFDADQTSCSGLCALLEADDFQAVPVESLLVLPAAIEAAGCNVLIMDLDNQSVNAQLFRDLKRLNPSLCIIILSTRRFHPELNEAFERDIAVGILKPVDPDELNFWMRSLS